MVSMIAATTSGVSPDLTPSVFQMLVECPWPEFLELAVSRQMPSDVQAEMAFRDVAFSLLVAELLAQLVEVFQAGQEGFEHGQLIQVYALTDDGVEVPGIA